jgi:hypothetical protein
VFSSWQATQRGNQSRCRRKKIIITSVLPVEDNHINQQALRPKETERRKAGAASNHGRSSERPPPPVYKFPSFSSSIYRGHQIQEEGRAPRTFGARSGSTSSRASSWLTSSPFGPPPRVCTPTPSSPFPLFPFTFSQEICDYFFVSS